jgi:hypothetical protein
MSDKNTKILAEMKKNNKTIEALREENSKLRGSLEKVVLPKTQEG